MLDREERDFRDDMFVPIKAVDGRVLWWSPALGRLRCGLASTAQRLAARLCTLRLLPHTHPSRSPTEPPSGTCGGYLADFMGSGKTIMTLALIASTLQTHQAPTLVVCTPSLVQQWKQELRRWLPGVECVVVNYKRGPDGVSRGLAQQLEGKRGCVAVVATTKLLRMDVSGIELHRVVFDEAHTLPAASMATVSRKLTEVRAAAGACAWLLVRADRLSGSCHMPVPPACLVIFVQVCNQLEAPRRWALSGTPVTSRYSLHAAFRALRFSPFDDWQYYSQMSACLLGSASYVGAALQACMLRRVESDLLALLPGIVRHPVRGIMPSLAERRVHAATTAFGSEHSQGILAAARRVAAGGSFDREALRGGMWRRRGPSSTAQRDPVIDPTLATDERSAGDCSICFSDPMGAPQAALPCDHRFCGECLMAWAHGRLHSRAGPSCPLCRASFRLRDIRLAGPLPDSQPAAAAAAGHDAVDQRIQLLQQALSTAVDALPADPRRDGHVLINTKPAAVAAKVRRVPGCSCRALVKYLSKN